MPTLVMYEALALEGEAFELGPESVAKIETVRKGGMASLSILREAGLPMAFGSDLLGQLQRHHCLEWEIRARVLPIAEIIRSANLSAPGYADSKARSARSFLAHSPTSLPSRGTPIGTWACFSMTARTWRRS